MIIKPMKLLLTFLTSLLTGVTVMAQISHGGEPYNWKNRNHSEVGFYSLPAQNIEALRQEDEQVDPLKNSPYRFGANVAVDLDVNNSGSWTYLPNGDRIWRIGINSSGATSLNFVFDQYQLPEDGRVFVYAADGSQLIGSFTSENASQVGSLGVGLIFSNAIVIEYHEPEAAIGTGYLHIDNVTHGYRSALGGIESTLEKAGPFGNSGSCNINVNCPEGLPYGIQKRSVAVIVVGNSGICTGALVNNTAQDNKPYFLTANHCTPGNNQIQNWVFYFNHDAAACNGNTGPTNQSVSGATVRAKNLLSDFALVEMNNPVPPSYNACYSGWDATDSQSSVSSAYGIHHPGGDVKKICFENNAPYHQSLGGFASEVWYIDEWELGVTEGGSSGSPLFNQSGAIIGQLAGGAAACNGSVNNGLFDFYGRIGVSWNTGSTSTTRLRDWLDPGNTGNLILSNSCSASLPANEITLGAFGNEETIYCSLVEYNQSITVFNTGSNVVTSLTGTVTFNGSSQPLNWTGNLAVGGATTINLGLFTLQGGINSLVVNIPTVNGMADPIPAGNLKTQNVTFGENPVTVTLTINFDDFPDETSWEIVNASGTVIYSGGIYSEDELLLNLTLCLNEGCYTFVMEDNFGDGICCQYGNGFYSLTDATGTTLASGGEFEDIEETAFCVQSLSVNSRELAQEWSIFPNPARTEIQITTSTDLAVKSLRVFDPTGRAIGSATGSTLQSGNSRMDISAWPSGIYIVQIETVFGLSSRKLVVTK